MALEPGITESRGCSDHTPAFPEMPSPAAQGHKPTGTDLKLCPQHAHVQGKLMKAFKLVYLEKESRLIGLQAQHY